MWMLYSIMDSFNYYRQRIRFLFGTKESSHRQTDEVYYPPSTIDWEGNDD